MNPGDTTRGGGLGACAGEAFDSSRRQLAGLLELATLETRYSAAMLGGAVALSVVVGVALLGGWGLFVAALVVQLKAFGWSLATALAAAAGAQLVLAYTALRLARGCIARLGLDHTRELLGLNTSDDSD